MYVKQRGDFPNAPQVGNKLNTGEYVMHDGLIQNATAHTNANIFAKETDDLRAASRRVENVTRELSTKLSDLDDRTTIALNALGDRMTSGVGHADELQQRIVCLDRRFTSDLGILASDLSVLASDLGVLDKRLTSDLGDADVYLRKCIRDANSKITADLNALDKRLTSDLGAADADLRKCIRDANGKITADLTALEKHLISDLSVMDADLRKCIHDANGKITADLNALNKQLTSDLSATDADLRQCISDVGRTQESIKRTCDTTIDAIVDARLVAIDGRLADRLQCVQQDLVSATTGMAKKLAAFTKTRLCADTKLKNKCGKLDEKVNEQLQCVRNEITMTAKDLAHRVDDTTLHLHDELERMGADMFSRLTAQIAAHQTSSMNANIDPPTPINADASASFWAFMRIRTVLQRIVAAATEVVIPTTVFVNNLSNRSILLCVHGTVVFAAIGYFIFHMYLVPLFAWICLFVSEYIK